MSLRGNVPLVWVAANLILYHSCYWNHLQFTVTNTSSTIDVPEFSFEASKGQFSLISLQWITRFISNPTFKFEVVSHPIGHTTNAEYACNHVHMCMYMCTQCLHMHAHTPQSKLNIWLILHALPTEKTSLADNGSLPQRLFGRSNSSTFLLTLTLMFKSH